MNSAIDTHQRPNWLQKLDNLVLDHLSDTSLTNAFFATKLGLSERTLYRMIQDRTGKSPNQYIRRIRMQQAKKLLASGEYLTVKEVVGKVGFRKTDYFTALFKEAFDITPIAFLKKNR